MQDTFAVYRELGRRLRKLEKEQGRVTRRNARERVLQALRALRHVVDKEYPAIKKPISEETRRKMAFVRNLSGVSLEQRMSKAGWTPSVECPRWRDLFEEADIRKVRKYKMSFYPTWAVVLANAGVTAAEIKAAKTSMKKRKVLLTRVALKTMTPSSGTDLRAKDVMAFHSRVFGVVKP